MTNNERVYYSHDAELHAVLKMTRLMIFCLLVGLGSGAALATLFAATTGKKVRERLGKSMGQSWSNGREAVEPMVKRAEKEFSDLQKTVEDHLK